MSLPPPRFLFLSINKACNLRCGHCSYWTQDDRERREYLAGERRREVIREFASLNPDGAVVICGGEPMLARDDYFDVAGECRRLGLDCLSGVNGTMIQTPEAADRVVAEGPTQINISLDAHRAELHDRSRGVAGAFDRAVRALRLLLDARRRAPAAKIQINAMALIFDENYRELEDFHRFALEELGVDKLKLNMLQPSFGGVKRDRFFEEHRRVDPDELRAVLLRCDERFGLKLNPAWLDMVETYFRSIGAADDADRGWGSKAATTERLCNTYERNVMVDHYGVARLCFSNRFPGSRLRRPGDLRRFWLAADDIRRRMRSCRALCGISHSVRSESATLHPAPFAAPPAAPLPTPGAFERLALVASRRGREGR